VIPWHEVSGVVAALGDGVVSTAIGDEVYGLVDFDRNGAAAEFVTAPAAANLLMSALATIGHRRVDATSIQSRTFIARLRSRPACQGEREWLYVTVRACPALEPPTWHGRQIQAHQRRPVRS